MHVGVALHCPTSGVTLFHWSACVCNTVTLHHSAKCICHVKDTHNAVWQLTLNVKITQQCTFNNLIKTPDAIYISYISVKSLHQSFPP